MKRFALISLVALMATTSIFAQANVSGTSATVAEPAVVESNEAGSIQSNGSKSFGFAISPDHSYGNVMIGYRFGKEDSSVPKQIVIGAEAKEMFRFGASPVLFGLSALGQARTNGSEFCVEYADIGASVGFEVGQWYFGLTPKVNIKTPKGLKVQLDIEFSPIEDCIIYGYGLALINTSDDNKNFVVSNGKWVEGPDHYQEFAGGVGAWYKFQSGCFVSLDTGLFYTNNEFVTKDGKKTCVSWKTTAKAGGEKLAAVFSYERGGELTADNKPVDRFTIGLQSSF